MFSRSSSSVFRRWFQTFLPPSYLHARIGPSQTLAFPRPCVGAEQHSVVSFTQSIKTGFCCRVFLFISAVFLLLQFFYNEPFGFWKLKYRNYASGADGRATVYIYIYVYDRAAAAQRGLFVLPCSHVIYVKNDRGADGTGPENRGDGGMETEREWEGEWERETVKRQPARTRGPVL